jgi:hypothetical protein
MNKVLPTGASSVEVPVDSTAIKKASLKITLVKKVESNYPKIRKQQGWKINSLLRKSFNISSSHPIEINSLFYYYQKAIENKRIL